MVRPGIRNVAPDGYVDFIFRFSDKAFPIYENSGVQVGKILDVDLQSQIVKAYGLAKSLIASTEINNEMLKRLETPDQQQLGVVYVARPDVKKLLVQYAGTLRKIDAALETTVHDLIARLDRYVTQVP